MVSIKHEFESFTATIPLYMRNSKENLHIQSTRDSKTKKKKKKKKEKAVAQSAITHSPKRVSDL